jgi:hypothetical protein
MKRIKAVVVTPMDDKNFGVVEFTPIKAKVRFRFQIPLQLPRRFKLVVQQTDQVHQSGFLLGPFDEKTVVEIGTFRGGPSGIHGQVMLSGSLEAYHQRLLIIYDVDSPRDNRTEGVRNRHGVPIAFAVLGEPLLPATIATA